MPHSSGGGSFSGGYSGPHGGGGPSHSYCRGPRPGAVRYIWYDRYFIPHSYYVMGRLEKPNKAAVTGGVAAAMIVACFLAFFMWHEFNFTPVKTDVTSYNAGIVLEDRAGVLTDDTDLRAALEEMREATGVTPSVEIVNDSAWKNSDLETFTTNEYLRLFNDECHWLFVVSYPDGQAATATNWSWHGVIGDNVGATVDEDSEDNCGQIMQKYLLRSDTATVGSSLASAFREMSVTVMTPRHNVMGAVIAAAVLLIGGLLSWALIADYRKTLRLTTQGKRVDSAAKTYSCEYCGCSIVDGSVSSCPKCGAPVKPQDEAKQIG